jgi:hypothetical protein
MHGVAGAVVGLHGVVVMVTMLCAVSLLLLLAHVVL